MIETIGELVTVVGVASGSTFALFKLFAEKWLEGKFEENLQQLKHQQDMELAEFRLKVDALFNRITKIHEKEIEVLPLAWTKLHDAVAAMQFFISPGRQYDDLNRMNQAQLDAFLAECELREWEKEEIRAADDKLRKYIDRVYWRELHHVQSSAREFHSYMKRNLIFLSADLKAVFKQIDDLIWAAIIDKEMAHSTQGRVGMEKTSTDVRNELEPLMERVEVLVRERLQYEKAK